VTSAASHECRPADKLRVPLGLITATPARLMTSASGWILAALPP
jgi:hypothetical protein